MQRNWILAALVAATIATTVYSAQPEKEKKEQKVHEHVHKVGQEKGWVSIMIELDEERGMTNTQLQDAVLAQLKGTKHKIRSRMDNMFALSLEVEPYALTILENSEYVKSVSWNIITHPQLSQSVPQVLGPGLTYGDAADMIVAEIDSGIDPTHSFLANSLLDDVAACFSTGGGGDCPNGTTKQTGKGAAVPCVFPVASADCKHGTQVAGVMTGKSIKSTDPVKMGVAPDVKIIPINIASWNGSTTGSRADMEATDIAQALNYVLSLSAVMKIEAVNMSLGGGAFNDQIACDKFHPVTTTAINKLRDKKIAVVIASGNSSNSGAMGWPACISSAVSVGASTDSNTIASYSQSASFLSLVGPGGPTVTSNPGGGFTNGPVGSPTAPVHGTSFAAPHVTAAWAIIKKKHPTATVAQVLNALQTNGFRITDTRNGRKNCRIQIGGARTNLKPTFFRFPIAEGAAYDLNNCGQVVGTEYVNWTGFRTSTNGSKTALVVPGADLTEPWGINNKDEISGFNADPVTFYDTGFVWTNGAFRKDKPSGTTSNQTFKNNDTLTTGYGYFDAVKGYLGYTLKGTTLVKFSYFPEDVDNRGRFAGWDGLYTDSAGAIKYYKYPNATDTYLHGRNESGKVVGVAWIGSGEIGFMYDTVTAKLTNMAPGRRPMGLNDSRQIVGYDDTGGYIDLSW